MSIDIYPKFRELKISDAAVFNREFKDRPPAISEFTFTNLYSWRRAYSLRVSLFDGPDYSLFRIRKPQAVF